MRLRFKLKKRYILIAAVLMVMIFMFMLDVSIKPTIFEISESSLINEATMAMNEAVMSCARDTQYSDLVNIEKNNMGEIVLLEANPFKMNELASSISVYVQQYIKEMGMQGISIPIGKL